MEPSSKRFEEYVSLMAQSLGHADRIEPFRGYCTGLMLPVKRKSVEPMAAHLSPERVRSEHQRLHHFVADAPWSDQAVLDTVRGYTLERISRRAGPPEALLIDDTGHPKKGRHSVGVARQYCGQLGKRDNCQVAVSVSLANENFSLPVRYQLYLPQSWADDADRRKAAKVPEALEFVTKPMLALQLLENLAAVESLPELVIADAGYGASTEFREQLTAMGFTYVVGVRAPSACSCKARHRCRQKNWPCSCRRGAFAPSHGGKAPTPPCRRALRQYGCTAPPARPSRPRPPRSNGCSSSGPEEKSSRPNTSSVRCQLTRQSRNSCDLQNCAGALSAITRSSSRNSASGTSRDAAGMAFITTQRCA